MYAETNECIHSIYTYEVGQECAQRPVKFFPYSVTSDLLTSGPIPALISFCALLSVVCNASPTGTIWHLLRIVEHSELFLQQIITKLCSREDFFECDKCL